VGPRVSRALLSPRVRRAVVGPRVSRALLGPRISTFLGRFKSSLLFFKSSPPKTPSFFQGLASESIIHSP